jgi:hypothetical protein
MAAPALNRKFWDFGFGNDEASFSWDLVDWAALAAGSSLPAPLPTAIPLAGANGLGAAATGWDQIFGSSDSFVFPDAFVSPSSGGGFAFDLAGAVPPAVAVNPAPDIAPSPGSGGAFDLAPGSAVIFAADSGASFDGAMFFTADVDGKIPFGGDGDGGKPTDGGVTPGAILSPNSFYVISTNGFPAFDISTISTFVDSNNVRHDTVTNFRPGLTLLQLDDADFSSPAAVLASAKQVGPNTVITVDASYEIILQSVALASLNAGSFLLV